MDKKPRKDREKESRFNEILDTAEQIFAEKGYDLATMDEIARKAEFTKRTVYGYFPGKYELYSAVIVRAINIVIKLFKEAAENGEDGFEKVSAIGNAYVRFFEEYPMYFKIMSIKTDCDKQPGGKYSEEVISLNKDMFNLIVRCFETGRKDGSIRADINVPMATLHVISASNGILEMVTQVGDRFGEFFGMNASEFIQYSMDLIGESIRSDRKGETK